MKILSLGCGNMGAAILSRVVRRNPEFLIGVIDPDTEGARARLPDTARAGFFTSLQEASSFRPDVVLLAVKPQQFAAVSEMPILAWSEALTVSVMAGTGVQTISDKIGTTRVARVMPNLPAMIGESMSVGFAGSASPEDRDMVERLFKAIGVFRWLDSEAQIDTCTAVSGSGPGYLFAFAAYLEQAALAEGVPAEIANVLTRQTIFGAAAMLRDDDRSAFALKEAVTSKGGTTEAGLAILEAAGALPSLIPAAVGAAHQRARSLS